MTEHFFKGKKKWMMLLLVVCLFCCSFTVNAISLVDVNAEAGLTVDYHVENVEFSLYKVADVTETYRFPVTEEFAAYQIDFNTLDTDEWKNVAETLAGYVSRDQLEPLAVGVTDKDGDVSFDGLSVGVYLVVGEQAQDEEYIYRCKSFLAFVPLETETGGWDYCPVFIPKPSQDPIKLLDLSVIKIWKDEGMEEGRPVEIVVQLLKDSEVVDEVILNEDVNWKFTWDNLSSEFNWQVVEKEVPADYTVEITQQGSVFEVINSKEGEPEKPPKLPQTGQLWWPVPILAVAGLLFFMIGWIQRRTKNEN